MHKIERIIHSAVGQYDIVRKPIVAIYQLAFSMLPVKDYQIKEFIQRPGYFFGFHDKCPWSPYDSKILAHKFDPSKSMRRIEAGPIEIGYFTDASLKSFKTLAHTSAWNWQQGSSLQWVGRNIVYNDYFKGEPIANIMDLNGNVLNTIPYHLACVSNNGNFALTFSFERLGRGMPGYGYQQKEKSIRNNNDNKTLGFINIATLEYKKLFDLNDVAQVDSSTYRNKSSFQFFSHCLFSKNDERFVFFHRWLSTSGKLHTRMISSDLAGKNLFLFPGTQFSHLAWKDNETVLAYFKPNGRKSGYYLIKDLLGKIECIAEQFLDSDGHPQISNDGRYIITDTYPDRFRQQYLKLYDLETNSGTILVKLKIPYAYKCKKRCDFHPRWNRDSGMICFDSAHNNTRSLCIITNISEIIGKHHNIPDKIVLNKDCSYHA